MGGRFDRVEYTTPVNNVTYLQRSPGNRLNGTFINGLNNEVMVAKQRACALFSTCLRFTLMSPIFEFGVYHGVGMQRIHTYCIFLQVDFGMVQQLVFLLEKSHGGATEGSIYVRLVQLSFDIKLDSIHVP